MTTSSIMKSKFEEGMLWTTLRRTWLACGQRIASHTWPFNCACMLWKCREFKESSKAFCTCLHPCASCDNSQNFPSMKFSIFSPGSPTKSINFKGFLSAPASTEYAQVSSHLEERVSNEYWILLGSPFHAQVGLLLRCSDCVKQSAELMAHENTRLFARKVVVSSIHGAAASRLDSSFDGGDINKASQCAKLKSSSPPSKYAAQGDLYGRKLLSTIFDAMRTSWSS
mmetsp:Transcript_84031/g.132316  ORF Transcript_84031/g.132316 Transcript_84031/m.132316 type:complete len:226 (-) Transcript_84031:277-954(-)